MSVGYRLLRPDRAKHQQASVAGVLDGGKLTRVAAKSARTDAQTQTGARVLSTFGQKLFFAQSQRKHGLEF